MVPIGASWRFGSTATTGAGGCALRLNRGMHHPLLHASQAGRGVRTPSQPAATAEPPTMVNAGSLHGLRLPAKSPPGMYCNPYCGVVLLGASRPVYISGADCPEWLPPAQSSAVAAIRWRLPVQSPLLASRTEDRIVCAGWKERASCEQRLADGSHCGQTGPDEHHRMVTSHGR